jgi:hypothetical protein
MFFTIGMPSLPFVKTKVIVLAIQCFFSFVGVFHILRVALCPKQFCCPTNNMKQPKKTYDLASISMSTYAVHRSEHAYLLVPPLARGHACSSQ